MIGSSSSSIFAWSWLFKAQFLRDCTLLCFSLVIHLLWPNSLFFNILEDLLLLFINSINSLILNWDSFDALHSLTVLLSFHHNPNWLWKLWLGFSPRLRLASIDMWAWCQGFLSMNLCLVSWRASGTISYAPVLPIRSLARTAREYWSMHNSGHICQSLENVSDNMLGNLKWH